MSENDEIEKRMIRAWAFNPDDLPFNQMGELSQRQRRWLQLESIGWGFQIAIQTAFIIFMWVFFYFQAPYNAKPVWWTGGLFWSVALGSVICLCIANIRPIWTDITQNEVKSVSGPISISMSSTAGRGYSPYWSLQIGDQKFSIGSFAYHSLINHQTYCVFYTPALKRVINIQPLFDADIEKQSALAALQERAKQNEENPT